MKTNRQSQEGGGMAAVIRPVMTSSFIGIIITAVILLLLSFLLTIKDLPHAVIEPLAMLAGIIGSMVSGFVCARKMRKNGLLLGALCGFINFLMFVFAGYVSAKSSIDMGSLLKAMVFIFSGAIGGVLGVNAKIK